MGLGLVKLGMDATGLRQEFDLTRLRTYHSVPEETIMFCGIRLDEFAWLERVSSKTLAVIIIHVSSDELSTTCKLSDNRDLIESC